MIDIIAYLLPMSGDILLSELMESNFARVNKVILPESFIEDCESIVGLIEQEEIPYRVPSNLNDRSFREWIESDEVDVGASVGYDKKLPEWLVNHPEHGTMNIHPSLLPRYRGANPYFWVIKNQESTTGVTLHYMDEEFDTGPIIHQQRIDLEPNETMGTLFFLLNRLGVNMMSDALESINETGTRPDAQPQESTEDPKKAPKVQDRDLRIDWNQPYEDVDALVRAGNPFFGAYTTFRGATVKVFEIQSVEPPGEEDESVKPGQVQTTEEGPIVRCSDQWALLNLVQVEQLYKCSGKEFQEREQKAFEVLDRMI